MAVPRALETPRWGFWEGFAGPPYGVLLFCLHGFYGAVKGSSDVPRAPVPRFCLETPRWHGFYGAVKSSFEQPVPRA